MKLVADNSVDVEAARTWLVEHKFTTNMTWPELGRLSGVHPNTLSVFGASKYGGDNEKIAANVLAYRDRLTAQADIAAEGPLVPHWYDTPSADHITSLLRWAQSGKAVLIVSVPGIGKTRTAERFAAADPNVWLATMSPSTAGVATMAAEVAEAVGLGDVKGSPQQISRLIRAQVQGKNGLLIVDEAQELTDKALNELRGLHDRTKVGIALLGNNKVVGKVDKQNGALEQIASRFSMRLVQYAPKAGDLDAALDAWGIRDETQRAFLARIGALPGALREVTHTLEVALLRAFGAGQQLSLAHLHAAAKQRNVKLAGLS